MHGRLRFTVVSFCLTLSAASMLFAADSRAKIPAPEAGVEAEASRLVKEVYAAEWAAAKTPAQKQALAKKLLQKARESASDKPGQFVLLRMSKELALQVPDALTAFEAINELERLFVVDALEMKADTLAKVARSASLPDHHRAVSQKAVEVSESAALQGNYLVAKQVADLAVSEAHKSNDAALLKQLTEHKARVDELAKAFEEAKAGLDILDKSPSDPAANLTVGKYYCFAEDNWKKGLPMLVLSGDPALNPLAETEIKGVTSTDDQVKLADRWLGAAEAQKGSAKKQLQLRAVYWYRLASPNLTGLAKDKVAKRIADNDPPVWIDVTYRIDPAKHAIKGDWQMTKDGITIKNAFQSQITLPIKLSENYQLEVEFVRLAGAGDVVVAIPVGTRHCDLLLSGWGGAASGIGMIDDKYPDNNTTTVRPGTLENNRKYKLHVSVKRELEKVAVTIELNGKEFTKYQGPFSTLSAFWQAPAKNFAALGAGADATVAFSNVRVMQQ